ncbi:putative golgi adaptor HA1/AP1 adaptin gamma subunit [Tilletiaria anomala UBC 951]|uniref:AP-1 complex subunit gamma n=1 Tax=Tilletiaria anomala (strain ATCC 24038 / CBS 436.72 / UBC 951) TaxID=1037660 RepID=A0A066VEJ3_TILAU|nr:putative golgi adaptor HA1/AP1 adaptin gamma subunit [Tilletiaria anomala UBC 951]KDN40172.1 putative golgi adaptor HA1/AP1 adaptin gamma subunit [Tilletiaria anomala UBC 951]
MSTFFAKQQQVAALDPRLGGLMASAGLYNLKALIKAIRACKTLADERNLIQKESASIRTAFKDEDPLARHNNIAKLLYIHMLGYPAHFGQIECLKLVATPRFTDKRLGYLGIMLLLDENTEVLTLVTNGLKNDMNHSNMYIVGLALCTFGNIASEEMSRDLCNEVEKLMGSSNTYIRRKAALCAMRIVRKVPDLLDHFQERTRSLLSDKNHGVLLCAVTLAIEIVHVDPSEETLDAFRKCVPLLVRHLKALVTTGYSPEHDVSGITDPFLQVKILRLLRILGKGHQAVSESMNDILAQVATNTEASKNVGNAILYETVLTILDIEAENGLRVMAINILGKFLGNRDNNIRYVALNTLNKVVSLDTNAVQRHRNIILDCLRDGDISIRRRALELSYALINESNVRVLTRELLSFLQVADNEFKLGMTTHICLAAEKYAPNKRWHIDTVLRVLKLAGNYVREDVLSSFIRLVCHTPELQAYTVQKLFSAVHADFSQESLTLAAVWVIGEFGEVLLQGGNFEDEELVREVKPKDIVDLLDALLNSPYINSHIRQYILTALAKLTSRIGSSDAPQIQRVQQILRSFDSTVEVEIQQRSVEYSALLRRPDISEGVLESMPLPEVKATIVGTVNENKSVGSTKVDKNDLLDLMGGDDLVADGSVAAGAAVGTRNGVSTAPGAGSSQQSTQDLLADIFGGGGLVDAAASNAAAAAPPKASVDDIMGLFGHSGALPSASSAAPKPVPAQSANSDLGGLDLLGGVGISSSSQTEAPAPALAGSSSVVAYSAYDQKGLNITLTPQVSPMRPDVVNILANFKVTGSQQISDIKFQAAVPKSQRLQMLAISSQALAPGEAATQQMRVMAPRGAQVRLRLRVGFNANGEEVQDQVDFSGFPVNLLG